MKEETENKRYRFFFRTQDESKVDAFGDTLPMSQYLHLYSHTTGLFVAYEGLLSEESLILIKLTFDVTVVEDNWT